MIRSSLTAVMSTDRSSRYAFAVVKGAGLRRRLAAVAIAFLRGLRPLPVGGAGRPSK